MNWNFAWMILGGLAFLLAIVNLVRTLLGKGRGWQSLMFASLSCGSLALLEEYRMVSRWLQQGDMAALYDVVPTLAQWLTTALFLGIALNLAVLLLNGQKGRAKSAY